MQNSVQLSVQRRVEYVRGFGLLIVIAIVGLYIVKWNPYFHRAFVAAANHSIGASVVSGKDIAPPTPSMAAALDYGQRYFLAIWQALLLGLLLAATLETLVPRDWVMRVFGSSRFRASILGGVLALPGMMCTCCSAPVVTGLRKSGASTSSSAAFFLGNPALNPAVLVFLVFTLGWQWAALRAVLAILLVFGTAILISRFSPPQAEPSAIEAAQPINSTEQGHWAVRWLKSFAGLTLSLVPEYIVLIFLLGGLRAFFFPKAGPELGNNLLIIVGIAVAGMLFAIPTAGEIPIIQTMRGFGMGAGPAGALLLTLAPISLPSLVMVARVFPKRVLLLLATCVTLAGIAAGLLAMALGL